MKVLRHVLLSLGILGTMTVFGWSSPLVVNGSFEDVQIGPPFLSGNPADIPGWTHLGSPGDALLWAVGYVDPGGSIVVAGSGNQFVTIGGGFAAPGAGSWSQTVSGFVAGLSYDLLFDIAAENPTTSQTVMAQVGSTTGSFVAPPSSANYWRTWVSADLPFIADSSIETISFFSTTQFDVGLDDVRITSQTPVPEPGSGILLTIGLTLGVILPRFVRRSLRCS